MHLFRVWGPNWYEPAYYLAHQESVEAAESAVRAYHGDKEVAWVATYAGTGENSDAITDWAFSQAALDRDGVRSERCAALWRALAQAVEVPSDAALEDLGEEPDPAAVAEGSRRLSELLEKEYLPRTRSPTV